MSCRVHHNWLAKVLFICSSSALLSSGASTGSCAVPTVSRVFPAGCQIGEKTRITITSNQDGKRLKVWCSREGVRIEPADKPNAFHVIPPAGIAPGLCWLRFFNDEGATDPRAFILGLRAEATEVEPNEHFAKATPAKQLPVVMNGILEKSGDVDCFSVTLNSGQTLVASVTAHEQLGSPVDCVMQVVSEQGFVLAQNDDDHGNDPQIAFTAKSSGRHVVRLFGFPEKPNSSVRFASGTTYVYRLSMTVGPFVDHTVPLFFTGDKQVSLEAVGWNLSKGLQVSATIPPGASQAVAFHAGVDNARTIPTFNLPSIRETQQAGAQRVSVPCAITGALSQPTEADRFEFEDKKGSKIRIRCLSRSLGQPGDPLIRIVNAAGAQLKEQDDATRGKPDCDLTFSIPADGKYVLEVRDRFDQGGWRYAYLLVLEIPQPDFAITLAASRYTVLGDKPLEIPVTVSRLNGFADSIEIRATGLPTGIAVKPVVSQPKGGTAKGIKLVLTTNGSVASNFMLSIHGTAGNSERTATAPSGIGDQRIATTWITAIPKKPTSKKKTK